MTLAHTLPLYMPVLDMSLLTTLKADMIRMTSMVHGLSYDDEYAVLPNQFIGFAPGEAMYASPDIYLVDGGQGNENLPLWPLLMPEREVDVIFANDNSADTDNRWPNGSSLAWTALRAQQHGLTTMPSVPSPAEIIEKNPLGLPLFFGCDDLSKVTIIYISNKEYTFPSNIPTWVLLYSPEQVAGMIGNSNMVATLGNDPDWPTCLACAMLMKKTQGLGLPTSCSTCFNRFCFERLK